MWVFFSSAWFVFVRQIRYVTIQVLSIEFDGWLLSVLINYQLVAFCTTQVLVIAAENLIYDFFATQCLVSSLCYERRHSILFSRKITTLVINILKEKTKC